MTSSYLTAPTRSLADATADRHGCVRRWPVAAYQTTADRDVDPCDVPGWGKTPAAAIANARRRYAGYSDIRVADRIAGEWTAVRFPDGREMPRAEFEAWAQAMTGVDVQAMIGGGR